MAPTVARRVPSLKLVLEKKVPQISVLRTMIVLSSCGVNTWKKGSFLQRFQELWKSSSGLMKLCLTVKSLTWIIISIEMNDKKKWKYEDSSEQTTQPGYSHWWNGDVFILIAAGETHLIRSIRATLHLFPTHFQSFSSQEMINELLYEHVPLQPPLAYVIIIAAWGLIRHGSLTWPGSDRGPMALVGAR